jgi:hypothetical protein
MNLYRNKENKLLYVLEHLVYDIKHLNRNDFRGIYPMSYKHHNHLDSYTYEKCDIKDEIYDPEKYVENNFEIVCEI